MIVVVVFVVDVAGGSGFDVVGAGVVGVVVVAETLQCGAVELLTEVTKEKNVSIRIE